MDEIGRRSDPQHYALRVAAVPQWIHLFGYIAFLLIGNALRICNKQGLFARPLSALEGHPLLITLALVAVIGLIVAPILFVNWSTRTWLRRFYPDKIALRWSADGLDFTGLGRASWDDVKSVSVNVIGKANRKKMNVAFKPSASL